MPPAARVSVTSREPPLRDFSASKESPIRTPRMRPATTNRVAVCSIGPETLRGEALQGQVVAPQPTHAEQRADDPVRTGGEGKHSRERDLGRCLNLDRVHLVDVESGEDGVERGRTAWASSHGDDTTLVQRTAAVLMHEIPAPAERGNGSRFG